MSSRIWQSSHPLVASLALLAGSASLFWYIWGEERQRAYLVLLGAAFSLLVAMLALWFFSLSFSAQGGRTRTTRLGTAVVGVVALFLFNAAIARIGLAK